MDVRRFFAHYFPHLTPARGWMFAAILGLTATSYVYREQPARGSPCYSFSSPSPSTCASASPGAAGSTRKRPGRAVPAVCLLARLVVSPPRFYSHQRLRPPNHGWPRHHRRPCATHHQTTPTKTILGTMLSQIIEVVTSSMMSRRSLRHTPRGAGQSGGSPVRPTAEHFAPNAEPKTAVADAVDARPRPPSCSPGGGRSQRAGSRGQGDWTRGSGRPRTPRSVRPPAPPSVCTRRDGRRCASGCLDHPGPDLLARRGRPGGNPARAVGGPAGCPPTKPRQRAVAAGKKRIENRTWSTPYRGTVYIHASSKLDRRALVWLRDRAHVTPPADFVHGAVAVVEIVNVLTWPEAAGLAPSFFGPYVVVLANQLSRARPVCGGVVVSARSGAAVQRRYRRTPRGPEMHLIRPPQLTNSLGND